MLETGLEPDDELESSEAIENRCTVQACISAQWSIHSKTPGGPSPSLSSIISEKADRKLELEDALELGELEPDDELSGGVTSCDAV